MRWRSLRDRIKREQVLPRENVMVLRWKNPKVQRHQQDPGAKMEKALGEQVVYCHLKASWRNGQFIMCK